jgi:hypothetical protein
MGKWRRAHLAAGVRALVLSVAMTGAAQPGIALADTLTVPAGGDLQAALDAIPAGGTVLLEAGATFTGRFVIRRAMTLRTDTVLPDARITPAWSGTLARLASPTNEPALRLAPGVSHVRVDGIEIAPNALTGGTALEVGSHLSTETALQPVDVVLDRLLVRGHPAHGQKRGLSLHGSHIVVRRSHVSDFKLHGQDTQAIWINNGWGPFVITDNYLEASGENILAGGDTPRIEHLVPADILIEGNHIAKPLAWKGEPWTVKNLVELKSGRRVTIRGNLLEGSWVSGQVGYGILLTPKDQYGRAPWTTVQDVLVEWNIVRDVAEAIRVLGDDHVHPAVRSERIVIRDNLLVVDHAQHGGSGRCLTVGRAPQQIEFSGNTCIADGAAPIYTYHGGDVRTIFGGVFRRNVFPHNSYGFSGEGATAGGVAALAVHYPDLVFVDNLIGGGVQASYPGNHVVAVSDFIAQFEDHASGNYRLTAAARGRFPVSGSGRLGWDPDAAGPWSAPEWPEASPPAPPVPAPPPAGERRVAVPRVAAPPSVPSPDLPARGAPGDRRAVTRSADPSPSVPPLPARTQGAVSVSPQPATVDAAAPPVASSPSSHAPGGVHASGAWLPAAPLLTLVVRAPADALPAGALVTLAVSGAHLPAPLVRVDITVDDEIVATMAGAPFDVAWRVPPSGSYRIAAVAVDIHGARHASAPLDVHVRRER